ncbi:MAG: hypothetical protein ABJO02_14775 [Reichenbachiella sp.]|uniref:hypothetical protein n=1 Tax=Reichenbachiella sp. TaxID=2184521 RepID=UPI003296F5CC
MIRIPTDYKILKLVYKEYKHDFANFDKSKRNAKVYVPIDIDKLSTKLNVDQDIIFGRLYYHCNEKYSYKNTDGSIVKFFALSLGPDDRTDVHCIQFPLMASILADLEEQRKRFRISTVIALVSIFIAAAALGISIATNVQN